MTYKIISRELHVLVDASIPRQISLHGAQQNGHFFLTKRSSLLEFFALIFVFFFFLSEVEQLLKDKLLK
jgi:hypothetical protein